MTVTTLPESAAERQVRYESLVLPHLDRLLGFAVRRTPDLGDAEDAVQDMCMRAWMAFDDLKDATSVRPWLFRILRTVLSDSLERSGRRNRLVPMSRLDEIHEDLVAGEADSVFAEVAARIDAEMLQAALMSIPEDFATAVELHDIDGFKYQEIADIVGVPIGTVMSRISRGRRLLAGVIMENRSAWSLGASPAQDVPDALRVIRANGSNRRRPS
ncbi:MAG: sigma-70 family RNA polymerase sigma factor [Gemmatimonadaceae bacterium]|nr:sigma-70 family RNA polymerase sigma factor [Gemmatimonadaceae bacterium]